MKISFTKISPTHHIFKIVRKDGTTDEALLETKSLMPHDLIHYAYESVAGLRDGFYGQLARGKSPDAFMDKSEEIPDELMTTEMIVGPLTSYLTKDIAEDALIAGLQNIFTANQRELPSFITLNFLIRVKETYRTISNRWAMLPHHTPLTLEWKE